MAALTHRPRLKVRFDESAAFDAAVKDEKRWPHGGAVLASRKRSFIVVEPPVVHGVEWTTLERAADDWLDAAHRYEGELVEDVQYDLESSTGLDGAAGGVGVADGDALDWIREQLGDRPDAASGVGVRVAFVDTGIDPVAAGIGPDRRLDGVEFEGANAWADPVRHGTLSAAIGCGDRGVAPGAQVISCRTRFFDSELAIVYDHLIENHLGRDGLLVISNSFGVRSGQPPAADPNSDFVPALREAIDAGALVVFSAGNYHRMAGGQADDCAPTSIWLYKCDEELLVVGASDGTGDVWDFSSRGPGQVPADKPDVVAPVPSRDWGTSAAAPQAAGLAALVSEANPGLEPRGVRDRLAATATPLSRERACCGAGQISFAAI